MNLRLVLSMHAAHRVPVYLETLQVRRPRSLSRGDTQVKRTSLIPPLKYLLNIWGLRGDGTDAEMVTTALGAALEPPPTYQW